MPVKTYDRSLTNLVFAAVAHNDHVWSSKYCSDSLGPYRLVPDPTKFRVPPLIPAPQLILVPWLASDYDLPSLEARIDTGTRPTAGPLQPEYPPTRCHDNQMGESCLGEGVGDRSAFEILGETQGEEEDDSQYDGSHPSSPLTHAFDDPSS